jgi:Tol biopolymer transport system component
MSPDSRRIVFLSERSGGSDVYLMNADGTGLARVTHTPWAEEKPAWAPDGRHLAVASSPTGNYDVYVYDLADVLRPVQ